MRPAPPAALAALVAAIPDARLAALVIELALFSPAGAAPARPRRRPAGAPARGLFPSHACHATPCLVPCRALPGLAVPCLPHQHPALTVRQPRAGIVDRTAVQRPSGRHH
jgi:hypothetical protein